MADAPQVAYAGPWLEADQRNQQWQRVGLTGGDPKNDAQVHHGAYNAADQKRTILGLRRRNFWILCILGMILVGAIVGGSVGGVAAVQSQNDRYVFHNALNVNTASDGAHYFYDSINRPAATLPDTISATSAHSSVTGTPPTGTSMAPSTTSSGAFYTPLLPATVLNVDVSCPSPARSFYNQSYTRATLTDIRRAGDIIGIVAYTVQQCIDACSSMNNMMQKNVCLGVAVNPGMQENYGRYGGNCFLKNVTGPTGSVPETTLLLLST